MMELLETFWQKIYLTFIYENRYLFFLEGLSSTLILTFASFILGTVFGVLLSVMQNSRNKSVRKAGEIMG